VADKEPNLDVAHLGHIEMLTPKPEESLRFFVDISSQRKRGHRQQLTRVRITEILTGDADASAPAAN
jgi:hypothetical protein